MQTSEGKRREPAAETGGFKKPNKPGGGGF